MNKFQRSDSHRLGNPNQTLLNLQMENKVRHHETNLIFKEKESKAKFVEIVNKIRQGDVPQLRKSMVVEELLKEDVVVEEHKEDVKDTEEQMQLPEIYEEKPEPESQEMQLVFKQGEPKMKAVVELAIKRFIKEKSWK